MNYLFLLAAVVYLALFAAAVHFTRATRRQVGGALAGGITVAVIGVGVEALAHAMGWWRYQAGDTPVGPPIIYPALVSMFAMLALIGWRVIRRYGMRGEIVFLSVLAVVGSARDYFWAGRNMITFAPGWTTVLVDAACWVGLTALAQGVMHRVAPVHSCDTTAFGTNPG